MSTDRAAPELPRNPYSGPAPYLTYLTSQMPAIPDPDPDPDDQDDLPDQPVRKRPPPKAVLPKSLRLQPEIPPEPDPEPVKLDQGPDHLQMPDRPGTPKAKRDKIEYETSLLRFHKGKGERQLLHDAAEAAGADSFHEWAVELLLTEAHKVFGHAQSLKPFAVEKTPGMRPNTSPPYTPQAQKLHFTSSDGKTINADPISWEFVKNDSPYHYDVVINKDGEVIREREPAADFIAQTDGVGDVPPPSELSPTPWLEPEPDLTAAQYDADVPKF